MQLNGARGQQEISETRGVENVGVPAKRRDSESIGNERCTESFKVLEAELMHIQPLEFERG